MSNTIKNCLLILLVITLSACSSQSPRTTHYPGLYETGKASYYADKYQGRQTANGERFNQRAMTAAHKTLRFGTWVKVTNVNNGRSVVVRINDRGPFIRGRIIDLSKFAFSKIANPRLGVVDVAVEVIK
jgi:rare lipoprotein A